MRMAVDILWQVLMPIFLVAGAGYWLARWRGVQPHSLAKAAFYLFSPCLLFDKFSHSSLSAHDLGRLALFAVLSMAGSGLIAWLIARLLRLDRVTTAAFMLCVVAGNTGNYGLPANQFAFGDAALEPAVVYYAVSTLLLSTVGVYIIARGRRSAVDAARHVLATPLAYAGVAGLAVWAAGVRMPLPVERFAALGAQAAIPVMLVILGVQLAQVRLRDGYRLMSVAAAAKLLSGPLLGIALAALLGLTGLSRQASIVEASMPTAVMALVLATEYDAAPDFTAGVVWLSTLASLITVTGVLTYLS